MFLLFRDMQGEGEAASLTGFAGHAHFLAKMLHDLIGDGEPQTGALAMVGFIDLVEAVKDVRQILRGDAHARVDDADADNIVFDAGAQGDGAALGRILESVIQQRDENLLCTIRIAGDIRQGFGNIVDERLLIILRVGGIRFMNEVQQGERRKDAPLQRRRAALTSPSRRGSISARMAVSGVRSSWETLAT